MTTTAETERIAHLIVRRRDGSPVFFADKDAPAGKYLPVEIDGDVRMVLVRGGASRKRDSKNLRSVASGCSPDQVQDFNKTFGHLGVRYDQQTGEAVYKDRAAKLRVIKARGYHDLEEVRG